MYILWPQNSVTGTTILNHGPKWVLNFSEEKKISLFSGGERSWDYSVPGKGWTEHLERCRTIWKEMGKIKHTSWFLPPHSTQKLNIGEILSISHRPSAYDLWLTGCPDVPSGKEASAIVLIVPLFALSFKANYLRASFSPWSQVSLENIPGRKTHRIPLGKMQIQLSSPPVITKANPSTPRIKLLVWARHKERETIHLLIIPSPPNPNLCRNKMAFCWVSYHFKTLSPLALVSPGPLNTVREDSSRKLVRA